MNIMEPGVPIDALALPVPHEQLPQNEVVAGEPMAGVVELLGFSGAEIGVWEMTAGTARDTEVDEVFAVLSGRATVRYLTVPESVALPDAEIGPGSVVRLVAGMHTEWTVHEKLRKIYVTASRDDAHPRTGRTLLHSV